MTSLETADPSHSLVQISLETKKGAEAPFFEIINDPLHAGTAVAGKLGIGFQATLAEVDTLVFLFLADADTHDHLDDQPGNEAGDEGPGKDHTEAQELGTESYNFV